MAFNSLLEEVVCGRFFKKGGILTPADWKEVSGSAGKKGKSGSLANNLWKSYVEMSLRVVEAFRLELIYPSKSGISCFCITSIAIGIERSFKFKTWALQKRHRIIASLGCHGFNDDEHCLIFDAEKKGESFMTEFLACYTNNAITKGMQL